MQAKQVPINLFRCFSKVPGSKNYKPHINNVFLLDRK